MEDRHGTRLPGFLDWPLGNAYVIPPPELQDDIISAFAQYVFPQLPVISLHQLVRAVDSDGSDGTVNLLLFQAVMFAGVAHVPFARLQRHGYQDHRTVRRAFFQRVEACFDAIGQVAGTNPVVLVQSLLLMTLHYDPKTDDKDSQHWMRLLLGIAGPLGMYHQTGPHHPQDMHTLRLWRRISWFTFTRDRIILLGARRPACIRSADFTLAPLEIEDFELDAIHTMGKSCLAQECALFRDSNHLRAMAELCVQQTQLVRYIDQVVAVQDKFKVAASPEALASAVLVSDSGLQDWWARGQARSNLYGREDQDPVAPGEESLIVHRAMLRFTYLATVSALHRPMVLSPQHPPSNLGTRLSESSRRALNSATNHVTTLAHYLYRHELWLFLPANAVTSLLPAIIVHIMNTKSEDAEVKQSSLVGFQHCLNLLAQLREIYANADDVYTFLETSINLVRAPEDPESEEVTKLSEILESTKSPSGHRLNDTGDPFNFGSAEQVRAANEQVSNPIEPVSLDFYDLTMPSQGHLSSDLDFSPFNFGDDALTRDPDSTLGWDAYLGHDFTADDPTYTDFLDELGLNPNVSGIV